MGFSSYRFLTIHGHRLAYRTAGPDDGEAVLLIHAFASQSQHLALAVGEWIGFVRPSFGCELWIDHAEPSVHTTNRIRELLGGHVF